MISWSTIVSSLISVCTSIETDLCFVRNWKWWLYFSPFIIVIFILCPILILCLRRLLIIIRLVKVIWNVGTPSICLICSKMRNHWFIRLIRVFTAVIRFYGWSSRWRSSESWLISWGIVTIYSPPWSSSFPHRYTTQTAPWTRPRIW